MPITPTQIDELTKLVGTGSLLTPTSHGYDEASRPWSIAYERHPAAVAEPKTESELAAIVQWLASDAQADVDFAVRGTGCGSSSAHDVIVSMRQFRAIEFDEENKTMDIEAGNDWGDVDKWLEANAPGYVVVGARCPYVGVAGSTLMGGLSWLSHSLGLGSDPSNMLDARIVLASGRVLWASSEAPLLWALRGGGGNFGVVTRLRLRAHAYSRSIWAGMIQYEDGEAALDAVSRGVAAFAARDDPHLALHVFVVDFSQQAFHGGAPEPSLVLLPFDAHGEAHARGPDGFAWALDIAGARADACGPMRLADVHELQRGGGQSHGSSESWLQAALVGEIDEGFVRRCWRWYHDVAHDPARSRFNLGQFALLEVMQAASMTSAGGADATAWPHAALGRRNVLQLSVGCERAGDEATARANEREALDIMAAAPEIMSGRKHPPGHFLPNFTLPNHDLSAIFGQNWDKLRAMKSKYDPKGRFNKGFFIPPLAS